MAGVGGKAALQVLRQVPGGAHILAFFDDWFDRVEIYFCPLSFEYVRRSGRVSRSRRSGTACR